MGLLVSYNKYGVLTLRRPNNINKCTDCFGDLWIKYWWLKTHELACMHIIGATFIISTRSYNWPTLKNCCILNLSLCLENICNMRWVNFDNIDACKFDQIATHMATWRRVPRSTICWWRWNFHSKRGQRLLYYFLF